MKKIAFFLAALLLSAVSLFAQPNGKWEGSIDILGQRLHIICNYKIEADKWKGTIDIPQQSAYTLPLSNMTFDNGKVHFELGLDPSSVAFFDGFQYMDSLSGEFSQSGVKGSFYLLRTYEAMQPSTENLPYIDNNVEFENGDILFTGTLSMPKVTNKVPAVVLVSGSGPQNRDSEIFGFKIFQQIADALASSGIAVLRYDDRGIGGSYAGPEDATTKDLAGDVAAAVAFLKKQPNINPGKIGIIGHSEGGMIAPLVASENKDVAFIVSIAGTGVPGDQISLYQIKALHKSQGTPPEKLKEVLDAQNRFYSAVRTGKGWDKVRKDLIELQKQGVHEEVRKSIPDWKERIEQAVDAQIKSAQSGWAQYFMTHDPAQDWAKVKVPALVVFGGKDFQVPVSLNKAPIEKALKKAKNKNYEIKIFDDANHLFQKADTGGIEEYSKLEKEFVPGFLDFITNWIIMKTYN